MKKMRLLTLLAFVLIALGCSGKAAVKPAEPFNPEKSFEKANTHIEKKEFDEARKILLELKNRDLSKKYAPLAQLKTADSYVREGEPELAVAEYRRFLDIYPDHMHAPYAQYQIAMVYFNQIESPDRGYSDAQKAITEFEKLKKNYPRNPYKDLIDMRIERCRNIMADYEYLVGEFYLKKESYGAAISRFEGLLKKYPDYKKEDTVMLSLGIAYKKSGEIARAESLLAGLIEKYPSSPLTKEAQKELSSLKKSEKK